MKYKFEIGDKVKVVENGYGCSPKEIKSIVTITELGSYVGKAGYKVTPPIGNNRTKIYGGFIGEESFELADKDEDKPLNRWYKYPNSPKWLGFIKDNNEGYGFNTSGNWFYDSAHWNLDKGYELASHHEIEEALIKEAKRRGMFLYKKDGNPVILKNGERIGSGLFKYDIKSNILTAHGFGTVILFNNGIWEEVEKKEARKKEENNYKFKPGDKVKIIGNCNGHNLKIGDVTTVKECGHFNAFIFYTGPAYTLYKSTDIFRECDLVLYDENFDEKTPKDMIISVPIWKNFEIPSKSVENISFNKNNKSKKFKI